MSLDSIITETRHQHLLRSGLGRPQFLQGVYPLAGRGVFDLCPLHDELCYVVPSGTTAEVIYFRAGNFSDDILYFALLIDGKPARYFPVGPKADFHVPFAMVETYPAGSRIEIGLAGARGLTGTAVVDLGIVEVQDTP